jgi:hypothetical protein
VFGTAVAPWEILPLTTVRLAGEVVMAGRSKPKITDKDITRLKYFE